MHHPLAGPPPAPPTAVVLAPEIWPLHDGERARAIAALVDAVAAAGIAPEVITSAERSRPAVLPRRLDRLAMTAPTGTLQVEQLEGRLPSGAGEIWAPACEDWTRLGPEALRRARRRHPKAVIWAIDEAIAGIAMAGSSQPAVVTVSRLPPAPDQAWRRGLMRAARVVVSWRSEAREPAEVLASARHRLAAIAPGGLPGASCSEPCPSRWLRRARPGELGVPGRIPMAVTRGPVDLSLLGELSPLARQNIALVVVAKTETREALASVADGSHGRLILVAENSELAAAARAAADLDVLLHQGRGGLHHPLAAVPGPALVPAAAPYAEAVVSWDAATRSGNGFAFAEGELVPALVHAARHLDDPRIAQYAAELRRRAVSWRRCGRTYARLISSLGDHAARPTENLGDVGGAPTLPYHDSP